MVQYAPYGLCTSKNTIIITARNIIRPPDIVKWPVTPKRLKIEGVSYSASSRDSKI